METHIILKVPKQTAITALTKLIKSGEQLLERSPRQFYEPGTYDPVTGLDRPLLAAAKQVRDGAMDWCIEVQATFAVIFEGFQLSESILIGDNKMFPKVSVLRNIISRLQKSSISLTFASIATSHPSISAKCYQNFRAGHYADPVFDAFKALENEIRLKLGAPLDEVGSKLIIRAMNPSDPKLRFSDVAAEQESVFLLFRGAIGFLKNPLSHRFLDTVDQVAAAEAISFASMLMRLLERAALV